MQRFILSALLAASALAVSAQTTITGTVTDDEGQPLPGAHVTAGDDLGFGTATDADGAFSLKAAPGPVRLRVSHLGHARLDTTITVAAGTAPLRLRLRGEAIAMRGAEVSALRAGDRAPFAQSTVTRERIDRINTGVDLPYVLEQQPSMVATSDGGTGIGYTYMRIRGTDATRTNITVNGVPFNDPESQGAFLVNMPDLVTSAEDIEVQRGVGTSTNGPAAFGASVNVRTTSVKREPWDLLSASGGSFNTQRYSVSAGTGLIADRFSLDLRLSSITSDGYVDRASADLKSYFVQAAWLGKQRSLRFITFRGREVTYQAWAGVAPEVLDTNRTYNPYTYRNETDNYDQTHYQLLLDQRIGKRAQLNLTLFRVLGAGYFEQYRTDEPVADYGIAPAVIDGDTVRSTDLIRRRWLDNALTGANTSLSLNLGRHRVVAGGSLSDYRGAHFGEVIWARWAGATELGQRYYDDAARKTDANGYAKLTYAFTDALEGFADAQVRQVSHRMLMRDADLAPAQQTVSWTFFNPKAGVQWRIRTGHRAYASVAVGNREPNREDLQETTPQSRPRSERLVDYELGYEHRSQRLSGGINLYYMDYSDQLVLTGALNDVGAALRTNVPRSYRTGAELSGAVRLARRLTWRPNATVSRNKVRSFTEQVDDWDQGGQVAIAQRETDLSFSPALVAGSELTWRIWEEAQHGSADLTLVTKHVGRQYLDNSGSADRMLAAYTVHDLRANLSLIGITGVRRVDVNLTLRNVLSALYESNGWVYSYYADGRRQQLIGLYPQAPLNVLGGVTVRF
jgi:iron complex outermembrane receptor protein